MARHNFPYLNNTSFLENFSRLKLKQQFVKIVVLSFDQKPIQEIEGKIQSGSITIDGSSAMRRTGNLTLLANENDTDLTNINNLLSINKKVQILIGFTNATGQYTDYPILWFPQGVFVIITPNISHSTGGTTISLTLHDKMALLNGECGGTLPASVIFHEVEDYDENGELIITQPTIHQIIQELVNHFGGEQLGKIIISDVSDRVKKVMKWTGSSPLYLYKDVNTTTTTYTYSTNPDLNDKGTIDQSFEYGEDVGFVYADFTYPGELNGNAGDTVVTILDQIKNTLGNYEYFYDINGNFVFQQIKNYLNKSYSTFVIDQIQKENYLVDYTNGKSVYTFDDSELSISYSNSPQYSQIKNDFVVWGKRKNINGTEYPIRYHLAFDSKPAAGNTYKVFFYVDPEDAAVGIDTIKAKKPLPYNSFSDFPPIGQIGVYYLDQSSNIIYSWNAKIKTYDETDYVMTEITTTDYRTQLYFNGVDKEPFGTASNYYFTELKNEWPKIYDIQNGQFFNQAKDNPSEIDFFLDLIDTPDNAFSVSNIGRRTSTIVDDKINCVFEPTFPDIVILEAGADDISAQKTECENQGQEWSQVQSSVYKMLINGGSFNSAYDQIKKEIYQYTNYNQQVTVAMMPMYYLEPNIRITIQNNEAGIHGDYMIKNISLPLDVAGTMSLTCTPALERL